MKKYQKNMSQNEAKSLMLGICAVAGLASSIAMNKKEDNSAVVSGHKKLTNTNGVKEEKMLDNKFKGIFVNYL